MNDIEQIKSKLNIVDVVREYVPDLRKIGRNWTARSPFRQEKTPSFIVNEEKGIFKDFGGDKAGDVIKFIENIENISFREALEMAAQKAGIELRNQSAEEKLQDQKAQLLKKNLLALNNLCTEIYHYLLLKDPNFEFVREYCANRGLTKDIIEMYKIGYAPKNLRLLDIVKKKLVVNGELPNNFYLDSGIFVERYGKLVNKFNDRLMFPIIDNLGQIVGFSGRVIQKGDSRPKYINSPDTVVYNKSSIVFNLYHARQEIALKDFAIITEGQIDAISSTRAGVKNIVAPLGTALTIEQLKLTGRYSKNIVFSFDNDSAGQKALIRAFDLTTKLGLNCKVLKLPKEVIVKEESIAIKDIDDLVRINPNLWTHVSQTHIDFIDYMIDLEKSKTNFAIPLEKTNFITTILEHVAKLWDNILQASYIQKLSLLTGIDEDMLISKLHSFQKNTSSRETYTEIVSRNISEETEYVSKNNVDTTTSYDPNELYIVSLVYNYPFLNQELKKIDNDLFQTIPLDILKDFENIHNYEELVIECSKIIDLPESEDLAIKEYQKGIDILDRLSRVRKIKSLRTDLANAESDDEVNEKLQHAKELSKKS